MMKREHALKRLQNKNYEDSFPPLGEGKLLQNKWHYWVLDLIGKAQGWFPADLLREYIWEAAFLDENDWDIVPYTMAKWDDAFLQYLTKNTPRSSVKDCSAKCASRQHPVRNGL